MLKIHKNVLPFLADNSLYHSQKIVATLDKNVLPKLAKLWHNNQQ